MPRIISAGLLNVNPLVLNPGHAHGGTGVAFLATVPVITSHQSHLSLATAERRAAFGAGAVLFLFGAKRGRVAGLGLLVASAPFFYRAATGRWPGVLAPPWASDDPKVALAGNRGVHVRESVRLELPIADVYGFWRHLDNLPRFMRHLDAVTEHAGTDRSHWVATGPAGLRVEWDAEIINEVENHTLAWRSLPDADVVTAGSVTFRPVRDGRSTQLTVHLQYAPPAGKAGAFLASLFGRAPEQTVREDLRRLKQLLEAGELARATASTPGSRS